MKILKVEPEKAPEIVDMEGTLEALQAAVGGYIEAVYPWEDPVAIICNDDGKFNGMAPNRALYDADDEIMDIIGIERVNEFCAEMEMPHTRLMRKMLDFEAIKKGYNNYMCAGEAGRLLTQIAEEKFVNREVSCTIMNIMEHQQCRNKLPALLPTIPNYAPEEVKRNIQEGSVLVANKTGELVGIQHDVGIFTLPGGRRYVIAMFTGNLKSDLQAIELIGKLSRAVYDSLK